MHIKINHPYTIVNNENHLHKFRLHRNSAYAVTYDNNTYTSTQYSKRAPHPHDKDFPPSE
jgi:hypothetical protein